MRDRFYSTAELARVCGVSISTIKRWTDAGLLRCVRTPGGHRKFRVQDVAEATRRLGLAAADAGAAGAAQIDELALLLLQGNTSGMTARLTDALRRGDGPAARRFVLDLHRHGQSLAAGVDLLRAALVEATRGSDAFVARRAEQIALAAARDLLAQTSETAGARALLVSAPGVAEVHSLATQIALAEQGWRPLDLGIVDDDTLVTQGLIAENAALLALLGPHGPRPGITAVCAAHGVPVLRIDAAAPIGELPIPPTPAATVAATV
jgi:excisionase family DNA binding protein